MKENSRLLFQSQWELLQELHQGLALDFLLQRFAPGKWSIHEHLAHLGRYHQVFRGRLKRILEEEGPKLARYVAEQDTDFPKWVRRSTPEVWTSMEKERAAVWSSLEDLSASQWQRIGKHPRFGPLALEEWLDFFLLHESHHIYSIFRLSHSNKEAAS